MIHNKTIVISILCITYLAVFMPARAQDVDSEKRGSEAVLWGMTAGTDAMLNGDYGEAKRLFGMAADRVDAIWSDTPEAERVRSIWFDESARVFIGEAYERMMLYYYMGILCLMENDYGNAQAYFYKSYLQDQRIEELKEGKTPESDALLPVFLRAWSLQAQGSSEVAQKLYTQISSIDDNIQLDGIKNNQPNVLVIAETGKSPVKIPDGVDRDTLKYFRGRNFDDVSASVTVDNEVTQLHPMEDIWFQAVTRGVREGDRIAAKKSRVTRATAGIGEALTEIGTAVGDRSYLTGSSADRGTGTVLNLVGAASMIFSYRAKAGVDFRHWDNLPDVVHMTTLDLPPGNHEMKFQFLDESGSNIPNLSTKKKVIIEEKSMKKPVIVWVSSRDRNSRYLQSN